MVPPSPSSSAESVASLALWSGSRGNGDEFDAQVGCQLGGGLDGAGIREAGGDAHGCHARCAEGLRGDARHQGRVDAAGEAKDRPGEPVLAREAPHSQHEGCVELGLGLHLGVSGRGPGGSEVHHFHGLGKEGEALAHPSVRVQGHAGPVEDQLVLGPHGVDHHEGEAGAARVGHPLAMHAPSVGGGAGAGQPLGAGGPEIGWGVLGVALIPEVLADQDARPRRGGNRELHGGLGAGGEEPAGLVEDVIGGQQALGPDLAHPSVLEEGRDVVEVGMARPQPGAWRQGPDEQGRAVGRAAGEAARGLFHVGHEVRIVEEVSGGIAADAELGIDDEMGSLLRGYLCGGHHAVEVARHVSHPGVDLGHAHPESTEVAHGISPSTAPRRLRAERTESRRRQTSSPSMKVR